MKRICPRCQIEMQDNCYIKDLGKSSLSYLQLIIKKEDYIKEGLEIKSCFCPQCGHIELYVDLTPPAKEPVQFDDPQELFKSVERYAQFHNWRMKAEQEKAEELRKVEEKKRLEEQLKAKVLQRKSKIGKRLRKQKRKK